MLGEGRQVAEQWYADRYLRRASQLLDLAAQTDDHQQRELLIACAKDFTRLAAEADGESEPRRTKA